MSVGKTVPTEELVAIKGYDANPKYLLSEKVEWGNLPDFDRKRYMEQVRAIIAASTESLDANRLPECYVDAHVSDVRLEHDANADRYVVKLKLMVDASQRFNIRPGSSNIKLQEIISTAQCKGGMLRISGTTIARSELEVNLIQEDGSMRDLVEGEGTW